MPTIGHLEHESGAMPTIGHLEHESGAMPTIGHLEHESGAMPTIGHLVTLGWFYALGLMPNPIRDSFHADQIRKYDVES